MRSPSLQMSTSFHPLIILKLYTNSILSIFIALENHYSHVPFFHNHTRLYIIISVFSSSQQYLKYGFGIFICNRLGGSLFCFLFSDRCCSTLSSSLSNYCMLIQFSLNHSFISNLYFFICFYFVVLSLDRVSLMWHVGKTFKIHRPSIHRRIPSVPDFSPYSI